MSASNLIPTHELKLTNVVRASLEELRLDYEDFLRQRELPMWEPGHPALVRFRAMRCASLEDLRQWVEVVRHADFHAPAQTFTDDVSVRARPCVAVPMSALVANAALSLLNLCCYLLDRQLATLAKAFEEEGGFTERLYRVRSQRRKEDP